MRILSPWRLPLVALVGIISFGPILVGIFPIFPTALISALVIMTSMFVLGSTKSNRLKQVVLTTLSLSFALTLSDLIARPLLARWRDDRPAAISPHSVSRLPQVYRYPKNVSYRDTYYGDLAIMAGKPEWREYRDLRFATDRFGFRNENKQSDRPSPVDLIMLGDSFGEGLGTSQESTWSSLLEQQYGLQTYNLSMDGAGPWQEFVNLSLEIDRLPTSQRTVVLWALFTGNDLDDDYYPELEREQLPWLSLSGSYLYAYKMFRWNSQVRRLLLSLWTTESSDNRVIAREFPIGRPFLFYRNYVESSNLPFNEVVQHRNYQMLKATITAMKKLGEAKHFNVVVVLIPSKEEVYSWVLNGKQPWSSPKEPSGFSRALKALSDEQQFTFLDLKIPLIDASQSAFLGSQDVIYWRDDTHWNTQGHKIAAAIVYQSLFKPVKNDQIQAALPAKSGQRE